MRLKTILPAIALFLLAISPMLGNGVADSLFVRKEYAKALPLYKELVAQQGTLSMQQTLRCAICITEATSEKQQAVYLLEKLAEEDSAPAETWYYLGLANQRLYRFEEAVDYYTTFLDKDTDNGELQTQAELNISGCENGMQLLEYAILLEAVGKQRMPYETFYTIYDTYANGYPAAKPVDMLMYADSTKSGVLPYGSLFFYPDGGVNADVIYFSSYGQDGETGLDIYRIRRIAGNSWSEPEDLGATINTPFDEVFPYISADGKTLYFSSNGHYGMGGFDVYRSVYDEGKAAWSTPENLGFPVSSPYDDFFFVPDATNTFACLTSYREQQDGQPTVYKLKLEINPNRHAVTDEEEIASTSLFMPAAQQTDGKATAENGYTVSIPELADNEAYLTMLSAARTYSVRIEKQQDTLSSLRKQLDKVASAREKSELEQFIIDGEQQVVQLNSILNDFQQAISSTEYEFITAGKQPVMSKQLSNLIPQEDPRKKKKKPVENQEPQAAFGSVTVSSNTLPPIYMREPSVAEEDKYRFRTNGKSVILHNDRLPSGVAYKIRIGVFSKELTDEQLKNLSPVTTEKRGNSLRYYVGLFKSYDEVLKALSEVKKKGFKDAVIDAWVNGKAEQTARARNTEKRMNQQSTSAKAGGKQEQEAYRVTVTVPKGYSGKSVPTLLNSLSGGKDISRKVNGNGSTTYSVGIFNNRNDAERVKNMLEADNVPNIELVSVGLK